MVQRIQKILPQGRRLVEPFVAQVPFSLPRKTMRNIF
nr:hypothetical protein [Heliorestis convoluta]